ncbi:hypothetical protein [Rossellomorea aquimaris]|uniref:hypothetical protein n=1 Tax=Rossellomorea aquimaris TaxID=189382 RepID=UPI0005C90DA7|nr:hypothetical protein [Rossellomorea aquimaris]
MNFVKGDKIKHEVYGNGTYSHWYAKGACIVHFDNETKGIKSRVVLYKEILSAKVRPEYDYELVLAEAAEILNTDPAKVKYQEYNPPKITPDSPLLKKMKLTKAERKQDKLRRIMEAKNRDFRVKKKIYDGPLDVIRKTAPTLLKKKR